MDAWSVYSVVFVLGVPRVDATREETESLCALCT